jgi:hypothetical protein
VFAVSIFFTVPDLELECEALQCLNSTLSVIKVSLKMCFTKTSCNSLMFCFKLFAETGVMFYHKNSKLHLKV